MPVFVKSRMLRDVDSPSVILPLDRKRHWQDIREAHLHDIPFRNKQNRLVWRGLTTGNFQNWGGKVPLSSRAHVAKIPINRDGIDIGYNGIVQISDAASDIDLNLVRAMLKPPLSIAEQLKARFLLSLEGNDVATGLKWMLYSRSTVIMPSATCETWACEGLLEPYIHYVPVKSDLSDLNNVFDWCLDNLATCEEIAEEGRRFMAQFIDEQAEMALTEAVVISYLEHAQYSVHAEGLEKLFQKIRRRLVPFGFPRVVRPRFP